MRREPIEYVTSGSCYFATEPDEKLLPAALETVGDDFILYASDYPHTDSKFPNSVKWIRGRDDVSEESKKKMLSQNGARFYGLEEVKAAGEGN